MDLPIHGFLNSVTFIDHTASLKGACALTISPPLREIYRPTQLFVWDIAYIRRALNTCSRRYIVYPEFAPQSGRLHYHIILYVHDLIKWKHLWVSIPKELGVICFNLISTPWDLIKWTLYCSKNWPITKLILDLQDPPIYHSLRPRKEMKIPVKKNENNILSYMLSSNTPLSKAPETSLEGVVPREARLKGASTLSFVDFE